MNDGKKNLDIKNYLKGHHFELGSKKNLSLNVQSPKTVLSGATKSRHYMNIDYDTSKFGKN